MTQACIDDILCFANLRGGWLSHGVGLAIAIIYLLLVIYT